MTCYQINTLEQLARQICQGEVVFFIGAGFSLDSEKNSAARLIGRLLVRFDALTTVLSRSENTKSTADALRTNLINMFKLKDCEGISVEENVWLLSNDYYPTNDWFCSAFDELLKTLLELDTLPVSQLPSQINKLENQLLERIGTEPKSKFIPLRKIDIQAYEYLGSGKGKALFLDTMGFDDSEIMASCYNNKTWETSHIESRLLPRHKVLGKWMKEGCCPVVVTSNYDMLLEGGCLAVGMQHIDDHQKVNENGYLPPLSDDLFTGITSPTDFFDRGTGHRTGLIVKIHGCVKTYRECKANRKTQKNEQTCNWQQYLRSMVFTYREIQNWRGDNWSKDYIKTLLRTHKFAFVGYSGMDPVLHDTIRTVYEEVAAQRESAPVIGRKTNPSDSNCDIPAYYFGGSGTQNFHGFEILRAASKAAGKTSSKLIEHQNDLKFHFIDKTKPVQRFPTLDEKLQLMFHLTYRKLQRQAFTSSLPTILTNVLGKGRPKHRIAQAVKNLDELLKVEKQWLELAGLPAQENKENENHYRKARKRFEQTIGWTEFFHERLLSNIVIAASQNIGAHKQLGQVTANRDYIAISQHPDWAAWCVVVELAIRRALVAIEYFEKYQKENTEIASEDLENNLAQYLFNTKVLNKTYPLIQFSLGNQQRIDGLSIKLAHNNRAVQNQRAQHLTAFRKRIQWDLTPTLLPWKANRSSGNLLNNSSPPNSECIWEWAHLPFTELLAKVEQIKSYFQGNINEGTSTTNEQAA